MVSQKQKKQRSPLRTFLIRLPLALIAAGAIWWLPLRPALDRAVPAFSELLIRSFEYPRVTQLVPRSDHFVEIRRSDFTRASKIPAIAITPIHFNFIVLLALYLALPLAHSRRQLERLLMGGCILYLSQVLCLLFHVKVIYATQLGQWSMHTYSDAARNFWGYLQYFSDLPGQLGFPFLIWLGFNWDQVLRLIRDEPEPKPKERKKRRRKG